MPRAGRVSHATLVPLGQPEKAMGHESPIEPWLAPDNRAACGLRTDWLRRAKAMKTAGKKDQKRCLHEAASRDHGTEGSNNPAQTRWAGRQEKIRPRESCFFLTPFIELIRSCASNRRLARCNLERPDFSGIQYGLPIHRCCRGEHHRVLFAVNYCRTGRASHSAWVVGVAPETSK